MSQGTGLKSRPFEAIERVYKTPNWVGNLLWLTLGGILTSVFVGQIAVFGYGSELIKHRIGLPGSPRYDVNSERIGDYISQGIWPFAVQFVIQLVASIVLLIPIGGVVLIGVGAGAAAFGEEGIPLGVLGVSPLIILISAAAAIFVTPFVIRSMIVQDFAKSFDFGWSWRFMKIMWLEIAISSIIFYLLNIVLVILGFLCCIVGVYVSLGIALGGAMHLLSQWYEIYLDRGGEPVADDADVIDATLV